MTQDNVIPSEVEESHRGGSPIQGTLRQAQGDIKGRKASVSTYAATLSTYYGALNHGSSYTFTDKDKVDGYRGGTQASDTTTVTVSSSYDHGTKENPYVIDTVARWRTLASRCTTEAAASTETTGKYFVLTKDLTFATGSNAFTPVNYFNGSFFGLNHNFHNVMASSTGENLGVFCFLKGNTVIADLSINNFNFAQCAEYAGGLVGTAYNDCNILNCHVNGAFIRTNLNKTIQIGGIMAHAGQTAPTTMPVNSWYTTIYRCSAKLTVNVTETTGTADSFDVRVGGIIGVSNNNSTTRLLDNYAHTTTNISTVGSARLGGAIATIGNPGRAVTIENFVGFFNCNGLNNIKGTINPNITFAAVANVKAEKYAVTSLNIKNTYVRAYGVNYAGETRYAQHVLYIDHPDMKVNSASASNLNSASVGVNIFNASLLTTNPVDGRFLPNYAKPGDSRNTFHNTTTALWSAAQGSSTLQPKIWTNKSAINDSYNYTVANSPVRNTSIKTSGFTFGYYNYKNAGGTVTETPLGIAATAYTPGSTSSISLPTTTYQGRTVHGYTTDVTGATADFTSIVPNGYYGDVKLYATYDVNDADVTKNISVSGGTQNSAGVYEMKYDGSSQLTVTGSARHSTMSDAVVEYRWREAGTLMGNTGGSIYLRNTTGGVKKYTLEYRMHSASEPLWQSLSWRTVGDADVHIIGLDVELKRFDLTAPAFITMNLGDIKFSAAAQGVTNKIEVAGTWSWEGGGSALIDEADVDKTTMKATKKLHFTSGDANYESAVFDVTFDVDYLKLIFDMDGIAVPIEIPVTYKTDYTQGVIAKMFEDEFLKQLTASGGAGGYSTVAKLEPYLDGLAINDYRGGKTSVNLTANKTIKVEFKDATYDVIFSYKDENGAPQTHTEQRKYGDKLPYASSWLTLPKGYLMKPWEFTDSAGVKRAWRFAPEGSDPEDSVTGDVTLTSEMFEIELTLESLTITTKSGGYTAGQPLKDGDITVRAHYTTNNTDMPTYAEPLPLGAGGYLITYLNPAGDDILHYDVPQVKVTYSYGSVSLEETVNVTVNKVVIDLAQHGFASASFKYGGTIIVPKVLTPYPQGITNVTYTADGNAFNDTDLTGDPIRTVTYNIQANVTLLNNDYSAINTSAILTVSPRGAKVKIEWDTADLPYNGSAQTPAFKVYRSDNNALVTDAVIDFGTLNAIEIGNYTGTVTINDAYEIESGADYNFNIVKAILKDPTFAGGLIYTGLPQNVALADFDSALMQYDTTTDVSGTDAGDYFVSVEILDTTHYGFAGGNSVLIDWTIDKAGLNLIWTTPKLEENGSVQHPTITRLSGLKNGETFNIATEFGYTGDTDKSAVGAYSVRAVAASGATWNKNYKLNNPNRAFAILPPGSDSVTLVVIEWSDTTLKYDGTILHPTAVLKDTDGNVLTGVTVTYGGDYYTSQWADGYTCTASVTGDYYVISGGTCDYTITLNDAGEGTKPDAPVTKTVLPVEWNEAVKPPKLKLTDNADKVEYVFFDADGNEITFADMKAAGAGTYKIKAKIKAEYVNNYEFTGGVAETEEFEFTVADGDTLTDPNLPDQKPDDGNGGFKLPENFPLWQIATSAVAIILILVFAGKCASYDAKKRKAKRDIKNYGTTYKSAVFLPVFSTVTVLFGLSNMVWSIIAFGLLGLMLLLFIVMLIKRRQYRKADDALAAAIVDDRRQRDEEMKMMLMGMMSGMRNNNGGSAQDTAQIVKDVVSALLPQMQAMLPAAGVVYTAAAPTVGVAAATTVIPAEYDEDDEDWKEVDDDDDVADPDEVLATDIEADPTVFETVDGKQPRVRSNFRVRLKATTDKNRGNYVILKNYINSYKEVSFRMSGRVEKVKLHGEVIAMIGLAKKSMKIWLALNPNNYDFTRYYHKDVFDKLKYEKTPMLIRVGSDRGVKRACELFDELFKKYNVEPRKKYTEKNLMELAFTLRQNPLFKDKRSDLLKQSVTDEQAGKAISDSAVNEYILRRERLPLQEENFATVSLDAIADAFLDGQTVNLQKLKAKGIVTEEHNGYKVTRGEKLTKPLCIVADGISLAAAKMIVMTGGIAVKLVNPDELDDKK